MNNSHNKTNNNDVNKMNDQKKQLKTGASLNTVLYQNTTLFYKL